MRGNGLVPFQVPHLAALLLGVAQSPALTGTLRLAVSFLLVPAVEAVALDAAGGRVADFHVVHHALVGVRQNLVRLVDALQGVVHTTSRHIMLQRYMGLATPQQRRATWPTHPKRGRGSLLVLRTAVVLVRVPL